RMDYRSLHRQHGSVPYQDRLGRFWFVGSSLDDNRDWCSRHHQSFGRLETEYAGIRVGWRMGSDRSGGGELDARANYQSYRHTDAINCILYRSATRLQKSSQISEIISLVALQKKSASAGFAEISSCTTMPRSIMPTEGAIRYF